MKFKNVLLITLIISTLISFYNESYSNLSRIKDKNKKKVTIMKLLKEIKKRTEVDLKRLGIEKMLLSNNGRWESVASGYFIFKPDGKVIMLSSFGLETNLYLWKIVNNILYMALFNNPSSFIHVNVGAIEPGSYEPDMLDIYKYALSITSNDKIGRASCRERV